MEFGLKSLNFDKPVVMGIINVTPDSFSDGGVFTHVDAVVEQAGKMLEAGAQILDIGGESTRPGATPVSLAQELSRVVPAIESIRAHYDAIISIDTYKPEVMQAAVNAGAAMINDVFALRKPGALEMAVELDVPVCLMHMQNQPKNMQDTPNYYSVVGEVFDFLQTRIDEVERAGLKRDKIIIDPGFGFGKTLDHNYQLLKHINKFTSLNVPVLAGMSRKSMIGELLNQAIGDRLIGSISCAILAAERGANIIRVHDVVETMEAMRILNQLHAVD